MAGALPMEHMCVSTPAYVEVRYVYWTFVGALFKDKAHQVLQLYGPLAEACEVVFFNFVFFSAHTPAFTGQQTIPIRPFLFFFTIE